MSKPQINKIKNGYLLEYLKDGEIIEAAEWNAVMQTIKDTVNANADFVYDSGVAAVQIVVSPNAHTDNKIWEYSDDHYFLVKLTKTDYEIDGPKNIKTYLIDFIQEDGNPGPILEEVQNSIKYSDGDIFISSKSNDPILIIIQGVGV